MAFPIPRFPSVAVALFMSVKHADTCLSLFLFIEAGTGTETGTETGGGDISGERLSS